MSRFALLAVALIIIVAIGSQPGHVGGPNESMCVCIPARARFFLKSAIAKTQARSAELFIVGQ